MSRKRRGIRWAKRIAVALTFNWALALAVFFADPAWTKKQLTRCYNWATNTTFEQKKPAEPCKPYESYAWRLSDSLAQYWAHSCKEGIPELRFVREIDGMIRKGRLIEIASTKTYAVDTMRYSFPYAVPKTRQLIDTIAERFQKKLINTDLYGAKLVVTSVLRTRSSVARLRRHNRNAIRQSAHLHGTTFDLSYSSYEFKRPLTAAEAEHLREVLAITLYELRAEQKCWVTYEIYQTCFHVVTR